MSENRCICCGEIIPEGRHVCPICEARAEDAREGGADDVELLSGDEPIGKLYHK